MTAKTRRKAKAQGNKYIVVSATGRKKVVTAKNIQEAYAKAEQLFPRAKIVTVSRKPAGTGREYETYIIKRYH